VPDSRAARTHFATSQPAPRLPQPRPIIGMRVSLDSGTLTDASKRLELDAVGQAPAIPFGDPHAKLLHADVQPVINGC
jgi:hypothetical protein